MSLCVLIAGAGAVALRLGGDLYYAAKLVSGKYVERFAILRHEPAKGGFSEALTRPDRHAALHTEHPRSRLSRQI